MNRIKNGKANSTIEKENEMFEGISTDKLDADKKRGIRGYIWTAEIEAFGYLVVLKFRESGRTQRVLANALLKLFGENKFGWSSCSDGWNDISVESQEMFSAMYPNVDTSGW